MFLILLLLLSAFFSGTETALFSLNNVHIERLKKEGGAASDKIFSLLKRPESLIITILIGNELVNLTFSVTITTLLLSIYADGGEWLAILISSLTLLLWGEITPKSIAIRFPVLWSRNTSSIFLFFYNFFSPLRYILIKIVNIFKGSQKRLYARSAISEEEFKTLIDLGKDEGEIEEDESEMIHNVIEFEELTASKVMTPRTDMFCIEIGTERKKIMEEINRYRFSRIPIYNKVIDSIAGILYTKELLSIISEKRFSLKSMLHSPLMVPGTKRLDELLAEFRRKKVHIAIVIDEYGGVIGLVTMEDLLEELFGEITGEFEVETKQFQKISENSYRISGMYPISDFNELFKTDIMENGIETIGGYIFHLFGKVPKRGESINDRDLLFTIDKMKGARIVDIRVDKAIK